MDKIDNLSRYFTVCDAENIINILKLQSNSNNNQNGNTFSHNQNIVTIQDNHIVNHHGNANCDVNHRDSSHGHQTPLMRLCHLPISPSERLDILDLLLECGADTSQRDAQGRTVLHHACIAGCAEVMETLGVAGGCAPEVEDCDGDTPLILAARCGEVEVLEGLLESFGHVDLRPEHRNKHGQTALSEARRRNNRAICEAIESFFNMSSSDTEADPPPQTPNSRLRQPVHNPKHTPKSDLKQQSAKTVVTNTEMKTVTTTKVTRRQLRKKQSERLAPVIVSNHTTPAPNTHNRTHAKRRQHTVGIPDHISMLPKRNESIQKHMTDNFPQNAQCSTDDFRSMDEIERDYFEEFDSSDTGSEAESDAGYSDDDFCADDEGEETQFCDKTVTELQFSLQTTQTQTAERSGSFSLPDLRGKSSSLVGSSNPSSSASIRSEGAAVKQPVSLQQRFAGDVPKQELSLPQLAEFTQDSSTDETSTDDSYKEPLTPRSRAGGKRNSLSLPELPSHRPLFPVASLITPRGVDLVFAATDSDSSAPNTYRGPLNSNHDASNMHDNLPQISSRSVKTGAYVGTPRGSVARVEQPDSWLYNKSQSQRKAGLRLVGANYNT